MYHLRLRSACPASKVHAVMVLDYLYTLTTLCKCPAVSHPAWCAAHQSCLVHIEYYNHQLYPYKRFISVTCRTYYWPLELTSLGKRAFDRMSNGIWLSWFPANFLLFVLRRCAFNTREMVYVMLPLSCWSTQFRCHSYADHVVTVNHVHSATGYPLITACIKSCHTLKLTP